MPQMSVFSVCLWFPPRVVRGLWLVIVVVVVAYRFFGLALGFLGSKIFYSLTVES